MPQIDRNSLQDAQTIVEKFLPNEQARKKFIHFLGNVITFSNSVKPDNWMLNLDKNGQFLRFNIGQEYCIDLNKCELLILCDRTTIHTVVEKKKIPIYFRGHKNQRRVENINIEKVPDCLALTKNSIGCVLKNEDIERYIDFFSQSNKDFIMSAMNTTLLPQYKVAHSLGAVEYIFKEFGREDENEPSIVTYNNVITSEYLENKSKLEQYFPVAYAFLESIENQTDDGFHIGTVKHLHLYYRDSLLFYFEFLSNTSVRIGKRNGSIKENTKSDYVYFFEVFNKNFETSELKGYDKFLFDKKHNKFSLIINNSENSELIFDLIYKTLNEIKNGDFQYNIDFSYVQQEFEKKVIKARKWSQEELLQKIRKTSSNNKLQQISVKQTIYIRDANIKAFVLNRANGYCEKCKKFAPFLKDDDATPFLEVHHKIPLSEGGKDTIENTIALCPNCHRHAHYGKNTFRNL